MGATCPTVVLVGTNVLWVTCLVAVFVVGVDASWWRGVTGCGFCAGCKVSALQIGENIVRCCDTVNSCCDAV